MRWKRSAACSSASPPPCGSTPWSWWPPRSPASPAPPCSSPAWPTGNRRPRAGRGNLKPFMKKRKSGISEKSFRIMDDHGQGRQTFKSRFRQSGRNGRRPTLTAGTGRRSPPALTAGAGRRSPQGDVVAGSALVLRPGAEVPPLGFGDGHVVDAGLTAAHQPVVVELPQLVAVAAEPLAVAVMALVLEADVDPVLPEAPQALAQHVIELALPFGGEELDYLRTAGDELVAVAPDRVLGIGEADPVGIAGVPGVLGRLDLGDGAVEVERGERRAGLGHGHVLSDLRRLHRQGRTFAI